MKQIVIITGKICSGKSSVCEKLQNKYDYYRLSISTIVKKITGFNTRSQLTKNLITADTIIKQIEEDIKDKTKIVIDGPRQHEIVEYLHKKYNAKMIWLENDYEILLERYNNQNDGIKQNDQPFDVALERDHEFLGLKHTEKYVKEHGEIIFSDWVSTVVDFILK